MAPTGCRASGSRGRAPSRPPGATTTWSPVATAPSVSVPVTTVPLPLAANTRSTHSRGPSAVGGRRRRAAARSPSAAASASSPRPGGAATGTIGAPARNVPATRSATSSAASSTRSGSSSTSTFVRATTPWRTPTSSRIRRCSSLCGFHPSVAATTNRQASTPPTPASMLRRKRTWPGTSTKLTASPSSDGVGEAEVDREAAPLLLGEAVGVGAGERQDERRLAVVDVTGGGDHPHGRRASPRPAASN